MTLKPTSISGRWFDKRKEAQIFGFVVVILDPFLYENFTLGDPLFYQYISVT